MIKKEYERITGACFLVSVLSAVLYDRVPPLRPLAITIALLSGVVAVALFLVRARASRRSAESPAEARMETPAEPVVEIATRNEVSESLDQMAFPFASQVAEARAHVRTQHFLAYWLSYSHIRVEQRSHPSVDTIVGVVKRLSTENEPSYDFVLTSDGLVIRPQHESRRRSGVFEPEAFMPEAGDEGPDTVVN